MRPKKSSKPLKVCLWLFGVVFGLLPIGATYMNARLDSNPPSWVELLAGGELFLISGAVAADAVFKALRGGDRFRGLRVFRGACCFLIVVATALYFGRIAYSQQVFRALLDSAVRARDWGLALHYVQSPGMDHRVIAGHSFWFFISAVVAALCIIIVEED